MEGEAFWRRDEVAVLLTAWRDAVDDPPPSSSSSSSAEYTTGSSPATTATAPSLDTRVFERFCAAFNAEPATAPRSFKSVKKTRKSLLRSFRFIAVFSQNLVIARSMSPLGGTNWFALPADEQQRVVRAHYKRKPFAYIDANMFEAIELIQAAEDHARRRLEPTSSRGSDNDEPDELETGLDSEPYIDDDSDALARLDDRRTGRPARFGGQTEVARALRLAKRRPEPANHEPEGDRTAVAPAARVSSSWTREDMVALLQAWEECLDEPRFVAETVAVFDGKVFDRFQELTDGRNLQRSATAVRLKKYSVIPSYQFITDFDHGLIPAVGDAAGQHEPGRDQWFDLDLKYRAAVVATHYQKSKYANIEPDMLPTIERIIAKAGPMEPRKGPLANRSPLDDADADADDAVSHEPWSRYETSLLLHAWSEGETLAQSDPRSTKLRRGLDTFVYERFCVHCGGESTRSVADVVTHKRALVNTFDFIQAFDRDASASASTSVTSDELPTPPTLWFALRKGERKRRLREAARPCTPIDENAFNELRWIFQVRKQTALQSTLAAPALPPPVPAVGLVPVPDELIGHVPPRSILVWSRDEVWNLLNAWTEVLDASSAFPDESLVVQNDRIFARYVELNGGSTLRSVKALQAKRDSVITSYHFICDFNDQKIDPPGRIRPGTNWYKLSYEEQKSVIKAFYKKVSFSYLYLDMLPTVQAIIDKTPELDGMQDPTTYTRKSRQKGWTRDEMDWFLQAWYEVVHVYPRGATSESAAAFNTRLHARFVELSAGRSKKAEVTLMTKRRVLTTTYAFVAEFNQRTRARADGTSDDVVRTTTNWFALSEVERKKKMASANKVTHTCTTIDEETFVALHQILGGGNPLELLDVSPEYIPSWVVGGVPRVASPTSTMYDSVRVFVGVKRPASSLATGDAVSAKRRKPSWFPSSGVVAAFAAAPNIASKTATMYDSVRAFIREIPKPSSKAALGASDRRTRSTNNLLKRERRELNPSPKAAAAAEALHAKYAHLYKKRQRSESEFHQQPNSLDTIAVLLDKQTDVLASMLEHIKQERQVEQAERKQLFDSILQNQADEQRRNREELAKERELEKWRWEQIRDERRADREQTRQLLEQLVRLQAGRL